MKEPAMRQKFEKWLADVYGFHGEDIEWQEERNCYAKFGIHLAFQAWQEALNSPETPDGWVACSERVPDADGVYWCWFGKEDPSVIQQRVCIWINRQHEWCDSAVTHWMQLPAAPKPEK